MHPFLLSSLIAMSPYQTDGGTVVVKGQRFLAEVARTDQERARGMMYRTQLAKDRCMIFIYDEDGPRPIWMKNCLIALDVVWIKSDGTIVEIKESAPPLPAMFRGSDMDIPSYGGKVDSRHFIEFASGTVRRLKLKIGDRVGWELQFKDGSAMRGGVAAPKEGGKTKKGK